VLQLIFCHRRPAASRGLTGRAGSAGSNGAGGLEDDRGVLHGHPGKINGARWGSEEVRGVEMAAAGNRKDNERLIR